MPSKNLESDLNFPGRFREKQVNRLNHMENRLFGRRNSYQTMHPTVAGTVTRIPHCLISQCQLSLLFSFPVISYLFWQDITFSFSPKWVFPHSSLSWSFLPIWLLHCFFFWRGEEGEPFYLLYFCKESQRYMIKKIKDT